MMFLPLSRRSRPASASSGGGTNPMPSSSSPAASGNPTAAVPDKEASALCVRNNDENSKPKSSFSSHTPPPPPPLLPPPTALRSSLPLSSSSISNSNSSSSPPQNPLTATLRPSAGGATTTAAIGSSGAVSQNHNNLAYRGGGGQAGGVVLGVISNGRKGPTPPHAFSFSRAATAMGLGIGQGGGGKSNHSAFGPHYNVAAANIGFRVASTAQANPAPFVSGETKMNFVIPRIGRAPLERKLALEMDEEEKEIKTISKGCDERKEALGEKPSVKDSMPPSAAAAAASFSSQGLQHRKRAAQLGHVSPTEEPLSLEVEDGGRAPGEDAVEEVKKNEVAHTSPQHTFTLKEDDAATKRVVLVEEGGGDEDDAEEDEEEAVIVPAPQAPQAVSFRTDSADAILHFVTQQLPPPAPSNVTLGSDDDAPRTGIAPHPPLTATAAPLKGAVGIAAVAVAPPSANASVVFSGRRPQSAGVSFSSVFGPPRPSSPSSYAILEGALLAKGRGLPLHQNPPRRHSSSSSPFISASHGLQSVTQKEAKSESALGSTAMALEVNKERGGGAKGVSGGDNDTSNTYYDTRRQGVGDARTVVSIARYFPALELQALEESEREKVVNEYLSGLFGGELEEEEQEGTDYGEEGAEGARAKKNLAKPRTLGTTPLNKAAKSLEVEDDSEDDDADMQVGPRFASKSSGTLKFFTALAGARGVSTSTKSKSTAGEAKVEGRAPTVSSDVEQGNVHLPVSDGEGVRQEDQRRASLSSSSSLFSTIVHFCVFSEEAHFRECLEAYRDVHWQTLALDEIEMRELAARESFYQLFLYERELLGESQFIVLEQKCRATIVREHAQWLEKVMTFVNAPPSEEAILEAVCSGSLSERAAALIIDYHGRMGHLDEFAVDGSMSENNFWGLMIKRMREAEAAENSVRRRLSLLQQRVGDLPEGAEGNRRNKKKKSDTLQPDSPLQEDQSDLDPVEEGDRKRKASRPHTRKAAASPTSSPSNKSPNAFNETPSRRNKKGATQKSGKNATTSPTRVSSSPPKNAGTFATGHTSSHLLLEDYLRLFPLSAVSPHKQSPPPPFKVAAAIDRTINNVTPAFEKAVAEREKDRQRKRLEAIAERLNGLNESLLSQQQQQNGETSWGRVGGGEEGNEERRPRPSRPSTANHSFNRLSSRAGGAPSASSARPASALKFRFDSPGIRSPSSSSGAMGGKGNVCVRPTRPFTSPSAYRKGERQLPIDANVGDKGEGEGTMGMASRQRQLVSPQPRAPRRKTERKRTGKKYTEGSDVDEDEGEKDSEVDARVLSSTNPPHLAKRISSDDDHIYDDVSDSSTNSSADGDEHHYGPRAVGKALKRVLEDYRFLGPNPSRSQIQTEGGVAGTQATALLVNTNDPTTASLTTTSAPRNVSPGLGEFIKRARSGSIQSTTSVRSSSAVTAATAAVPVDLDSFFMPSLPPSQRDGWRPNGSNAAVGGSLKRSVSQQGMHRIPQEIVLEGEGRRVSTPSPSPFGVMNMNTRAQTESQGRGVSNSSRRTSLSPTPPPPIPTGSASYLPPPAAVRVSEEDPAGMSSRRTSVSSTAPPQPSRRSSSSYVHAGRPLAFGAPVPTREKSYREELEDHMRSGGHVIGISELGGGGGGGGLSSRRPSAATMSRRGSTAGGAVSGIGSSSSGDEGGGGVKRARRTRSSGNKQLRGALTIPTSGPTPSPSSPAGSTASANNTSGSSPTIMGRHVQTPYFTTHFAAAPPAAVPSRTTSSSSLSKGGRPHHAGTVSSSTKSKTDTSSAIKRGGGDATSLYNKSDLWSTEAVARREVDLRAGAAEDRVMLRSRSSGLGGRALGLRASLFAGLEANAAHHSSRPTSSSNNQQREGRVAYRRRSSVGVSPLTTSSKDKNLASLLPSVLDSSRGEDEGGGGDDSSRTSRMKQSPAPKRKMKQRGFSSLSLDESDSSSRPDRQQRRVPPPTPTLGEIRVTKKELDRASEDPEAAVQPSSIEQYTYIVPQTLFEYFIEQKRMYDEIMRERAEARRRVRAAAEKRLADETEAARAKFFLFKEHEEKRKQEEGVAALRCPPTLTTCTFPLHPSISECVKLMGLAGKVIFSADVSPNSSSDWMWHFIFFKTMVSKRHKALVMVSDVSGWLLPCLSVVATMSIKVPCRRFLDKSKGDRASTTPPPLPPPKLMSARLSSSSHHVRHPLHSSSGSSLATSQRAGNNTQHKTLEEIDRGTRTPSRSHRGGSRNSSSSGSFVSTPAPTTPSEKRNKKSLSSVISTNNKASESTIRQRSFSSSKLFSQLLASYFSREEVPPQSAEMGEEGKEEEKEVAAHEEEYEEAVVARHVYALIVVAGHRYLRMLDERSPSPTRQEYQQSSVDESLSSYMYM